MTRLERLTDRLRTGSPWAVVLLAGAFAMRRLDDTDTWWHLAAGRWIVEHGRVPRTDPFTFSVADHAWINLQWLFDVVLYAVFSAGGPGALVLLSTGVHVAAIGLMLVLMRRRAGPLMTTALGAWVVLIAQERFSVRPEMISLLLLMLVIWLLVTGRRAADRRLWWLPLLIVLWVNLHALYVLGLFVIGCAVAAALLARFVPLPARWRDATALDDAARRRLLQVAAACVGASLLNPFGPEGAWFPLRLLSRFDETSAFAAIGEFRSPFFAWWPNASLGAFQVWFVAGLACMIAAGWICLRSSRAGEDAVGRFDLFGVAVVCGLAYLAFAARRNTVLFAVASAPFLAGYLATVLSRVPAPRARPGRWARAAAAWIVTPAALLATFAVAGNHYYAWDGKTHESGLGVLELKVPRRAVEFCRRNDLPGPLFNDITTGGYLIWSRLRPEGVYMDGRLEVHDDFFARYMKALRDPAEWNAQAEEFGLQGVLLYHRYGNRHPLIRRLAQDPAWALVYHDEVAAIFVRVSGNEDAVRRAIEDFPAWRSETLARLEAAPAAWPHPRGHVLASIQYARLLDLLGDRSTAASLFGRVVEYRLPRREAFGYRMWLAGHAMSIGDRVQARLHLERAQRLAPDRPEPQRALTRLGG